MKIAQKLMATLVCLSMSVPVNAVNKCRSKQPSILCESPKCAFDPCTADNGAKQSKLNPVFLSATAGALLGVAVGAGITYAVTHNRNNHCCAVTPSCQQGAVCSKSTSCHKTVEGSILTFSVQDVSLVFTANIGVVSFSATATMFVTTPDGCTIYGDSYRADSVSSGPGITLTFANVNFSTSICNASCGSYQSGILITATVPTTPLALVFTQAPTVTTNCPPQSFMLPFTPPTVSGTPPFTIPYEPNIIIDFPTFNHAPDCCVVTPSCKCTTGSCGCR